MEPVIIPINNKNKSQLKRIIGTYDRGESGTTIICFCSIHGNEPTGKIAFERVIETLRRLEPDFEGKIIGVWGNMTASTEHERFIDMDLNRVWTEERIKMLDEGYEDFPEDLVEDLEQKYLWKIIHQEIAKSLGPIIFLDLHTTSSESQPFISINDTLKNRFFARRYPLPIILGLEEHLDGTILSYINELGHIAIGVEGGQHDALSSIENHEAIIWSTLSFADCINSTQIPEAKHTYEVLAKNALDGKRIFEVRYRHQVDTNSSFTMNSGYINFQPVRKNEVLAKELDSQVQSPEKGRLFMPLYQKLGNDGFFIVREIRKFWLDVSAFLRKIHFHRFIQFLPGIGKYKELDHTIVVNRKIARWYVIDFFHLLGFRRKLKEGNKMIFIRRPHDL
ncbi:MAG: succinylglutamate desuccinylase/aspartoacylase family protein [Ekhidna sp.]